LITLAEHENYFLAESFKGNQTIYNRESRKRGGMGDKRKLEDKIPVLIVADRSGGLTEFVREEHKAHDIHEAMRPIVKHDSIFCSDGAHAYRSFAKELNIKHYTTIVSKGDRVIGGQFHIQNVNGYISCGARRMARSLASHYQDSSTNSQLTRLPQRQRFR
jgi:hypothetical protein